MNGIVRSRGDAPGQDGPQTQSAASKRAAPEAAQLARQLARSPEPAPQFRTNLIARAWDKVPKQGDFTGKMTLTQGKQAVSSDDKNVKVDSGQFNMSGSAEWKPKDGGKDADPNDFGDASVEAGFNQVMKSSKRKYVYTKDGTAAGEVVGAITEAAGSNKRDQVTMANDASGSAQVKGSSATGVFYGTAAGSNGNASHASLKPGASASFTMNDQIKFDVPITYEARKGKGTIGKIEGGDTFVTSVAVAKNASDNASLFKLAAQEWQVPLDLSFNGEHKAKANDQKPVKEITDPAELAKLSDGTGNAVIDSIRLELPTSQAEAAALSFTQKIKALTALKGSSDPDEVKAQGFIRDALKAAPPTLTVHANVSKGTAMFREVVTFEFAAAGGKSVKKSQKSWHTFEQGATLVELLGENWVDQLEGGARPEVTVSVGEETVDDEKLPAQSTPWPYPYDKRGVQVLSWESQTDKGSAGDPTKSQGEQEKAKTKRDFQIEVTFLGMT